MELPPLNMDDFNRWKTNIPVIKETDMEEAMQAEAKDHITAGVEKFMTTEGCDLLAASRYVKENMDNYFGPSWHCIIGEGFSFEVTRQQNTTILMYYAGTLAILLFKC